ncbi:MAG: helix-turn-helix domain-containing protein [Desulfovibrio sp.]|nr:helix-turn-helix domain-containing protein [Desulfovibrio sp.]
MKNITTELKYFFEATGVRQCQLAEASGVSTATINRLVKGVQSDVRLSTADSLRNAMAAFRQPETPPAEPACEARA